MFLLSVLGFLKGKITLILSIMISLLLGAIIFLTVSLNKKEADIVILKANILATKKGIEEDLKRHVFSRKQHVDRVLEDKKGQSYLEQLYIYEENFKKNDKAKKVIEDDIDHE